MALSLDGLLYSESTLQTQLALTAIWGSIWYVLIKVLSKKVFEPFVLSKPWCKQWTELNGKTFKSAFMIDFESKQEIFEFACLFLAILCQHAVGAAMCIPSLLGYTGPAVSALACHGALCEAGWELQDTVERAYQITLGGKAGKAKNPPGLLLMVFLHHSMGLAMVIPMNIMYSDNRFYHELVFLLQGAAFVALMSQNYGYSLDVKTESGLKQMRACVSLTLVTMMWGRLFRYAFVGYHLMATFIADGSRSMTIAGGSVMGLMGVLNVLFLLDASGKFTKFMKMKLTSDRNEVEEAAGELFSSTLRVSSTGGIMTKSQKEWAKVRGAYRMGVLKQNVVANQNQ